MKELIIILLFSLPSIIFYICSWRTKKRALQIIFGLLTLISPLIIIYFWSLWSGFRSEMGPKYVGDFIFLFVFIDYILLSIFTLIYALVSTIVFKKSKKPVPIVAIVIGIIIIILTISFFLYILHFSLNLYPHPDIYYYNIIPPPR